MESFGAGLLEGRFTRGIIANIIGEKCVLLSLERFTLMEKAILNSQYLAKLDRAFDQLYSGKGQEHEPIEA